MTPDELRTWMTEHGYSVAQLAAALGVGDRIVYRWLAGEVPVSRTTELALMQLDATRSESPTAPRTQS